MVLKYGMEKSKYGTSQEGELLGLPMDSGKSMIMLLRYVNIVMIDVLECL